MEFQLGSRERELAVRVEYEDPSGIDRRLTGSRVLPVHLSIRNVSKNPIRLHPKDVGLNLNGNGLLVPVDEREVVQEMKRTGVHPALLGQFFANQSSVFFGNLYPQIQERLKELRFPDSDIKPGKTREGLIFFMRPAETNSTTFNGVMWLEWLGTPHYSPQILETKSFRVTTKPPNQAGFMTRIAEIWTQYFSGEKPTYNKSYAFLVGIGQYQYLGKLSSPAQDVKKMEDFLKEQGFDEIVTVQDESVTTDMIRFPQKYFKSKIASDDRFLFYYSGHGMSVTEGGRTRGYLPLTGENGKDLRHSIAMDSLVSWMKELPARHVLVILDACFSGLAVDGLEFHAANLPAMHADPETVRTLSRERGQFLLMAGDEQQESFGDRRWNGSVFTEMLIKGLRKDADLMHNKIITTRELYVWLQVAVSSEARKVNRELTPMLKDLSPSGSSKGEFIFVQ